jgi:hypothetical protein
MRNKLCRLKRVVKDLSNGKDDDDDNDDSSGSSEEEHACSYDQDAYSSDDSNDEAATLRKRSRLGPYRMKVGVEA